MAGVGAVTGSGLAGLVTIAIAAALGGVSAFAHRRRPQRGPDTR